MLLRNLIFLLTLTACGVENGSSAAEPDALSCSVTFEKYAIIAKMNGDERLSKGLHARQRWYVEKVRALPAAERSQERIDQLAKQADAVGEKDLAVLKSCMERQDKDPAYKAWLRS